MPALRASARPPLALSTRVIGNRKPGVIDLTNFGGLDARPERHRHRQHLEMLDHLLEGVVLGTVVHDDDLELRVGHHGHRSDRLDDADAFVVGGHHDRDRRAQVRSEHVLDPSESLEHALLVEGPGRQDRQSQHVELHRHEIDQDRDREHVDHGSHDDGLVLASSGTGPAPSEVARGPAPETARAGAFASPPVGSVPSRPRTCRASRGPPRDGPRPRESPPGSRPRSVSPTTRCRSEARPPPARPFRRPATASALTARALTSQALSARAASNAVRASSVPTRPRADAAAMRHSRLGLASRPISRGSAALSPMSPSTRAA